MGNKKKRVFPDAEEILSRPWCYYCERDFDDLKILISHQKAKHFKCERCGRRLNTAGGLSVHMTQVHKETLTTVENALPNRSNLDVEIFGMEGIPEDVIQAHRQRVLGQIQQAEAERTAATGNPAPGAGAAGSTKKPKFESPSELKKRLAEHKAKMAEQAAGGSSGSVTPMGAGQSLQSPSLGPNAVPYQAAGSPTYHQQPQHARQSSNGPYPGYSQPYDQQAYPQVQPAFAHQQLQQPAQQQGFESPGMMQYPIPGNQYPVPQQYPHPGGQAFPPQYHGGPRPYGVTSPPLPFQQNSPQILQIPTPPPVVSIPARPGSLPPAVAGLPQRPSFTAPPVNAFQMQQLHQGQVLGAPGQPPAIQSQAGPSGSAANGSTAWNGGPVSDASSSSHAGAQLQAPAPSGDATSLDDLVGSAARNAGKADVKAPDNGADKKAKKEKDKATKLIYSDDRISPEEKMASLPRYAFDPSKREETGEEGGTTNAVANPTVEASDARGD